MKLSLCFSFCILIFSGLYAQQSIDGTIPFQNDPAKKYSLYIPSNYDASVPNPLMVGLHPLNTRRWNSQSWRDFLVDFAEENGLLVMCPDGGPDGRIDDPIDTAFTTFLMDSTMRAYNIHADSIYAMGFSWGGRTTYTYGLRRPEVFRGYMPIGAAINATAEIAPVIPNSKNKPVFIVHGSNDAPANRFTPAKNALINAGACVQDSLMPGVGHTVDVNGINEIFTMGYNFLRNSNCGMTTKVDDLVSDDFLLSPNPQRSNMPIQLKVDNRRIVAVNLATLDGRLMNEFAYDDNQLIIHQSGVFLVTIELEDGSQRASKMVIE